MLQRKKESTNSRDHQNLSCMLHFLFDEYKFFQSYYPTRELAMTDHLFGSLIQHQLHPSRHRDLLHRGRSIVPAVYQPFSVRDSSAFSIRVATFRMATTAKHPLGSATLQKNVRTLLLASVVRSPVRLRERMPCPVHPICPRTTADFYSHHSGSA
jgi:hypothetical protein